MHISAVRYRVVNLILAIIVIVFGVYLFCAPFWPEVRFRLVHSSAWKWLDERFTSREHNETLVITPRARMNATQEEGARQTIPEENTLSIPSIDVYTPILEGASSTVLEKGIWRRPKTGTPVAGSNTVLVGHRFLYTSGPNTFYHLDKLKVGDEVVIFWSKERFTYIVDAVLVTTPDAVEIEAATIQPTLTLYTCTPLFSVDKRLVVRAHLVP